MDMIARELSLDPAEFRRRNLLKDGDLLPNGHHLEHVRATETLEAALERNAPITYRGPEVTRENLGKLQEVGLLQDVREEGGNLHWSTTKKGEQLHAIIFDQVVVAIRSG